MRMGLVCETTDELRTFWDDVDSWGPYAIAGTKGYSCACFERSGLGAVTKDEALPGILVGDLWVRGLLNGTGDAGSPRAICTGGWISAGTGSCLCNRAELSSSIGCSVTTQNRMLICLWLSAWEWMISSPVIVRFLCLLLSKNASRQIRLAHVSMRPWTGPTFGGTQFNMMIITWSTYLTPCKTFHPGPNTPHPTLHPHPQVELLNSCNTHPSQVRNSMFLLWYSLGIQRHGLGHLSEAMYGPLTKQGHCSSTVWSELPLWAFCWDTDIKLNTSPVRMKYQTSMVDARLANDSGHLHLRS